VKPVNVCLFGNISQHILPYDGGVLGQIGTLI